MLNPNVLLDVEGNKSHKDIEHLCLCFSTGISWDRSAISCIIVGIS